MNSTNSSRTLVGIESTAWCFSIAIVSGKTGELLVQYTNTSVPTHGLHESDCIVQHLEAYDGFKAQAMAYIALQKLSVEKIFYSKGPGFAKCLRLGFTLGQELSMVYGAQLIGLHHGIGHLALVLFRTSTQLQRSDCVLYVSGGHTHILRLNSNKKLGIMLETPDLAVGNLLDKVGRVKGLTHPAGPKLEALYKLNTEYVSKPFSLPLVNPSYNGISTKFSTYTGPTENMALDLLDTVFNNISAMVFNCCKRFSLTRIIVIGGVAQSTVLQDRLLGVKKEVGANFKVCYVSGRENSDSGYNIALAGYMNLLTLTSRSEQSIDPHFSFEHLKSAELFETETPISPQILRTKRVKDSLVMSLAGFTAKRRFKKKIQGLRRLSLELSNTQYVNLVTTIIPLNICQKSLFYDTKLVSSSTITGDSDPNTIKNVFKTIALLHNNNIILGEIRSKHIRVTPDGILLLTSGETVERTIKSSAKAYELENLFKLYGRTIGEKVYCSIVDYNVEEELCKLKRLRRYN
jgi:glycoprotease/Kae1 family metallohydrolase